MQQPQLHYCSQRPIFLMPPMALSPVLQFQKCLSSPLKSTQFLTNLDRLNNRNLNWLRPVFSDPRKDCLYHRTHKPRTRKLCILAASSSSSSSPFLDNWAPEKGSKAPSLSDVFWPSAGAFAAMALLGKIDQMLAPRGISMTIAPLGAVCAVLFATPASPGARKYNMFMAQIGCAAIGVVAFTVFGPGWLARSSALAAAMAFMIYTRSVHPPAASLPLLFIDGVKLHRLNYMYALFPGAAGCILLCLIQEIVCYLKENFKF